MAVLGARRLANSGKATRLFGGRAVSTVSSAHPQLLARSSLARVLRSQARCGRRRAGLPPTPFGLPAYAVAKSDAPLAKGLFVGPDHGDAR
jgi:hypothetical protein